MRPAAHKVCRTEAQVNRRLMLDGVIGQRAAAIQRQPPPEELLLVRWDSRVVLHDRFQMVDGVPSLDSTRDLTTPKERLHDDLHAYFEKTQNCIKKGLSQNGYGSPLGW